MGDPQVLRGHRLLHLLGLVLCESSLEDECRPRAQFLAPTCDVPRPARPTSAGASRTPSGTSMRITATTRQPRSWLQLFWVFPKRSRLILRRNAGLRENFTTVKKVILFQCRLSQTCKVALRRPRRRRWRDLRERGGGLPAVAAHGSAFVSQFMKHDLLQESFVFDHVVAILC